MKVLHICYNYGMAGVGGAAVAASRLHQALSRHGVESHFACYFAAEQGENIHVLPRKGLARLLHFLLTRAIWCLGYLFPPKHDIFTPNLVPLFSLKGLVRQLEPDVIHVHWYMMDLLSFRQLADFPCPVVMTLHDLFDVNAVEPNPREDRRYVTGFNRRNSTLMERWLFNRKRKAMAKCSPLLVGPSNWICEEARRSIIGRGLSVEILPNPIDKAFAYHEELRSSQNKMVVLFGCACGTKDSNKGWDDLVAAIKTLTWKQRARIAVRVFGESADPFEIDGCEVSFVGEIREAAELCRVYHTGDVFALPSRQDNAPQTKFEALMCGLPVVAFRRSGCAEFINLGENGWLSDDGDIQGYAEGLANALRMFESGELDSLHRKIAADAARRFDEAAVVSRVIKLYSSRVPHHA